MWSSHINKSHCLFILYWRKKENQNIILMCTCSLIPFITSIHLVTVYLLLLSPYFWFSPNIFCFSFHLPFSFPVSSILPSLIQLRGVRRTTSSPTCQQRTSIVPCAEGKTKIILFAEIHSRNISSGSNLQEIRKKKTKKPCEDNCNKCQQRNAFFFPVTLHGFSIIFHFFVEKLPPETAAGGSTAGRKAVMTFLTALRLKPKGNFTVNFKSRNVPVASRDLCGLLCGQPCLGLSERERGRERQSGLFAFSLFSICFLLLPFLNAACFVWWVIGNLASPKPFSPWRLKGFKAPGFRLWMN